MKMSWNNMKMLVNISSDHLVLGNLIHELSLEHKKPISNIKNFSKKLKLRALCEILLNESIWQALRVFKFQKKDTNDNSL